MHPPIQSHVASLGSHEVTLGSEGKVVCGMGALSSEALTAKRAMTVIRAQSSRRR